MMELKTAIEGNSHADPPRDISTDNLLQNDQSEEGKEVSGGGDGQGDKEETKEDSGSPEPKQTKGLCKFGRTCTIKNLCEYSHEPVNKACRFGNKCTKKDACLFGHNFVVHHVGPENHENRKSWGEYEDAFTSRNVLPTSLTSFQNPEGDGWSTDHGRFQGPHFQGSQDNQNTDSGANQLGGGPSGGRRRLCKNGTKCTVRGCIFSHDMIRKACRAGADCQRMDRCLFLHDDAGRRTQNGPISSVDMNVWLLRSKNGNGRA